MIDIEKTIISQYANSPTIVQLVQNMNDYIDPRADIDNFYDFVWNVDTAQGFGLDIWGRIVDVGRAVQIPGGYPYILEDYDYRKLILAKAMANISVTTSAALNQILTNYFSERGKCYVLDTGSMTMTYRFEFSLTTIEYAIVQYSGILPSPAGVLVNYVFGTAPFFGWDAENSSIAGWDAGHWT